MHTLETLRLSSNDAFFLTYGYVRVLNTRQWTSLRVLSTPYVYVGRKNAALEINPSLHFTMPVSAVRQPFSISLT